MLQRDLSRVILNKYSVNIELGGRWFNIKMPSITKLAELYEHWGVIEETEDITDIIKYREALLSGFKVLISPKWYNIRKVNKSLKKATLEEILNAYIECSKITNGDYFFQIASSISNAKKLIAKQKS